MMSISCFIKCDFPEYNMFTELLSPIDLYKNIDILDELFKNPYESMTVAKGIKKYFETQLEEDCRKPYRKTKRTCLHK